MGDEEGSAHPLSDDGSDASPAVPLLKRQRTSVSVLSVDVHGQVEVAGLGFDEDTSAVRGALPASRVPLRGLA